MLLSKNSGCTAVSRVTSRRGLTVLAAVKQRNEKHVVCSKMLTAKQQDKEHVLQMCKDVVTFSEAEARDKKNGIFVFQCVRDSWDDHVFHFWERYDSSASMTKHLSKEPVARFMEKVQPYLEGPIAMALYEYKDGKIGHACVLEGPKGEGGLDDATGASGAAGGASMKQSSATVDLTKVSEHQDEQDLLETMKKQLGSFTNIFQQTFGAGARK